MPGYSSAFGRAVQVQLRQINVGRRICSNVRKVGNLRLRL